MTNQAYQIILCTCPNQESAQLVANTLVDQQLAACVTILPGSTSVYRWKGKIETSEEHLLIIKSKQVVFTRLEQALLAAHPYELPEIVAVPIIGGSAAYLSWIDDNVSTVKKRDINE
jgi:periplasmic divalent cation tolerance protein